MNGIPEEDLVAFVFSALTWGFFTGLLAILGYRVFLRWILRF